MGRNESARVGGWHVSEENPGECPLCLTPLGGESQTSTTQSVLLSSAKKYACLRFLEVGDLAGLSFLVSWLLPSGLGMEKKYFFGMRTTGVFVTQLMVNRDTVEKGGDFGKMESTFPTKVAHWLVHRSVWGRKAMEAPVCVCFVLFVFKRSQKSG